MRRTPLFSAAFVILLVVGCGQGPLGASPGAPSVPGTSVATPSLSASAETPGSTPGSTPSRPDASDAPTIPDPATALDVSKTVEKALLASFASPSGRIWCAIYATDALCHFPYDFTSTIPDSDEVCPELGLDVTGVSVGLGDAEYFCSGDPAADPRVENSDSVATIGWWKDTGWPSAEVDGQKVATLPYGKALVAGDYVCASATNGITCANTTSGKGFRMARAGVTFIP